MRNFRKYAVFALVLIFTLVACRLPEAANDEPEELVYDTPVEELEVEDDAEYEGEAVRNQPVMFFEGSDDYTTEPFFLTAGPFIVTRTYEGERNFIVWLYDEHFNPTENWSLANDIDYNEGEILLYIEEDGYFILDVTADGDWSITFDPNSPENGYSIWQDFEGEGDSVIFVDIDEDEFFAHLEFHHDGEGVFIVRFNEELLINEIGVGTFEEIIHVAEAGTVPLEIIAEGAWTVSAR